MAPESHSLASVQAGRFGFRFLSGLDALTANPQAFGTDPASRLRLRPPAMRGNPTARLAVQDAEGRFALYCYRHIGTAAAVRSAGRYALALRFPRLSALGSVGLRPHCQSAALGLPTAQRRQIS